MSFPTNDGRAGERPAPTAGLWVGLALGVPVMAFGLHGLLDTFEGAALASFGRYFVGGAVLHDVVVAPAVCVAGWILARALPRPARAPVQAALIVSAMVGLVAFPFASGYGFNAGEPSFLARDYTAAVLATWAVVWAVALVVVAARTLSARRR